jgi:putative phosphoesterase
MHIAILSDTHGNHQTVAQALQLLEQHPVACILHCGDIDDAATVCLFAGTPTHFVLGNCDTGVPSLARAASAIGATLHGRFADLELAGKRIALIHGDDKRRMDQEVNSGRFDYLFHGHTHAAAQHRVGRTLVANPGALHRARPKTLVLLDLQTNDYKLIKVAD